YFIGFLATGVVARFVANHATLKTVTLRGAAGAIAAALPLTALVVLIAVLTFALSRAYQDRRVGQLVQQLLSAPTDPVRVGEIDMGIVEAPEMVHRFEKQSSVADRFQYAEYLSARFSRQACGQMRQIKVLYRASQAFFDDTRTVDLDFGDDSPTLW